MLKAFKLLFLMIGLICSVTSIAQEFELKPKSEVYLSFEVTKSEDNVDPSDAIEMMKEAIKDKTSLTIVGTKDSADFVIELSAIKKMTEARRASMKVSTVGAEELLTTKRVRGTANAIYGYSGVRHAIATLVKKNLLKAYPNIIW